MLWVCLWFLWFALVGGAVSITYHRMLAHRAFRARPWFRYTLVVLAATAGPPIQWASNHRRHHRYVDQEGDPHSPIQDGFWWAHCGWYLGRREPWLCLLFALSGPFRLIIDPFLWPSLEAMERVPQDLGKDRGLVFLSQHSVHRGMILLHLLPVVGFCWALGWPGLLIAWASAVFFYNLGDGVNSFGHLYGERDPANAGEARDTWWLALLTFGEGWHGFHHAHPRSPRMGPFDFGWWAIWVFDRIGLIEARRPEQGQQGERQHA
ncbi:MAG: hypothetical protein CMH55_04615 [Myxococcales bacterium]|nr:hypothetical protein [Myxococcales bacterium]